MRQIPPILIQIAILISSCVAVANFSLTVYRVVLESKAPRSQPTIIVLPVDAKPQTRFTVESEP